MRTNCKLATNYNFYQSMVNTSIQRGEKVLLNHSVEGTNFKLVAYFPARNFAFVDLQFTEGQDLEEFNKKMRIIKNKSGIRNLCVWVNH